MSLTTYLRRTRSRLVIFSSFFCLAGATTVAGASLPAFAENTPSPVERVDTAQPPERPRVLLMEIRGPITAATVEHHEAVMAMATAQRVDLVLIMLDTPGGMLDATRDMVQRMLGSDVPISVWVGPAGAQAASAGTFIALAANVAAMHPTSNIGAAHPVTSGGGDIEEEAGKDMAKKVVNDTAAFIRTIAAARGRNEGWAEKAVRESVSATAEQAVKLRIVDLVASDVPSLLSAIDARQVKVSSRTVTLRTRDAVVVPVPMTIRQRTLSVLADPNIVALLMLIGLGGIALEFYHPGSIFPGVAGALCLLLGLLGTRVIPVSVGGVLLLVVGVGLFVAEVFVSTHGIAGAAGAVCVALGTLLFIDRSSPDYQFNPGAFVISPMVVWPTPIILSLLLAFVAYKVVKSRRGRFLVGAPGLVGETGETLSEVGPGGGVVFVHGEYWRARSELTIRPGVQVKVSAVEGLVATVVAEKEGLDIEA